MQTLHRLATPRAAWIAFAILALLLSAHAASHHHWVVALLWALAWLGCLHIAGRHGQARLTPAQRLAREHLAAAAHNEHWQPYLPDTDQQRPTEVIIGGRTYAVAPLTMPTLKAFMEAGSDVLAMQTSPLQGLFGGEAPAVPSAASIVAAYEAMYQQLNVLLVDGPGAAELGLYVPQPRLVALLQLLGPGA